MTNHLMRWAKVLGLAISCAALPMAFSEYVLTRFALASGQAEVDSMANAYLRSGERIISEAIRTLTELRAGGHINCEPENLQAFADAALSTNSIQEIGLVDQSGLIMCGAPASSKMAPLRLPISAPTDPIVTIGVLASADQNFGRVVVSFRVDSRTRLIARFRADVLDGDVGPSYLSDKHRVEVLLSDGSEWPLRGVDWDPGSSKQIVAGSVTSKDFPLHVMVSASGDAVLGSLSSLRFIAVSAAFMMGTFAFAASFWMIWSKNYAGDEFRRAVNNNEFVPYYQPVMDIESGELIGCEMLVRWIKRDGTVVSPSIFLPYTEATGLIRDITRHLMVQTVEDLADLYIKLPQLKLSINLTASHFIDMEIIDDVDAIYDGSGITYEQLMFEVTEQHPLKDIAFARRVIKRLQELGARVALDDVGTGHGGLAYVQKLGVDILKIDKLFVDGLGKDQQSDKIISTLVDLAKTLGMGVIAEGVEEPEQVVYLRKFGVTVAQGYAFSKALSAQDYRTFIAEKCAEALAAREVEPGRPETAGEIKAA